MNCDEVRELLHGLADRELASIEEKMLERHLQGCPNCRGELADIKALSVHLSLGRQNRAPADLDAKIRARLNTHDALNTASDTKPFLMRAASHAAALVLGVGLTYFALENTPPATQPAQQLVDVHIRHLMSERFASVKSSDKHEVRPWFVGKIDYSPPMADLAAEGFPLLGGRIDYLDGRPVAVLTYGRRKHHIAVYVMPTGHRGKTGKPAPNGQTSLRGFNIARYAHGEFNFLAISDLNAKELAEFANLMSRNLDAPAAAAAQKG